MPIGRCTISIKEIISNLAPLPINKYVSAFISGAETDRIKIQYFFDAHNNHFYARVIFGKQAQGPPGHAHGGAVAAVLDEAMGGASWLNGYTAMTVKLEINYHKSLPLETECFVETWVNKSLKNKIYICGKIVSAEGIVFAESTGLFIEKSIAHFKSMGEIPKNFLTNHNHFKFI